MEAARGGQQGLGGALLAESTGRVPLGFLWRRRLLPVPLGCGKPVGLRQTRPLIPVDALGFLLELSSQECGSLRVHMRVDDLGALGGLLAGLLWTFSPLLLRRGAVEAADLLEGIVNHSIDVLHVAGTALLIPGLLTSQRFVSTGGAVGVRLLPLLFLLLLTTPLLHLVPLLALDRAVAGAPLVLLLHGECLQSPVPLILRLGRPCGVAVYPRYFGLGGRVWRARFGLAGRWRRLPVALRLRCWSAISVLATAIVLLGLLGEASDAGVERRGGGFRATGGAFAVRRLEEGLLAALWFRHTGVLQGGVLPCIVLIGDGFWLLRCRVGAALLFAFVQRFFVRQTVHRPLVSALEGREGLLGRPGGGGRLLGRRRGGLDEAAVEGVLLVVVRYDYFGQFLSPQWNPGEFGADSAESSTQDPLGFFVVVVFVSTQAAAAQQRQQDDQQEGDQGSRRNHTHPLVGLEIASTRHGVAVLVVARAGLVAVHSVLAGLTGHVAVGAVEARVTQALPGDHVTDAVETVAAVVLAVLAVRAVGAAHLAPVPDPAGVAVRALAADGVAVVSVSTGGTRLLAALAKEALGAQLVAARPVPAAVAGDAAALRHLAGLLALAVPAPVPAVLTVEPGGTRLPAELPAVPRRAGTRAVPVVALALDALAVALAPGAPQPLAALAAARELVARRVVAVALDGAVPPRPARVAHAAARFGVAHRVDAAVAVVVAQGTPDARVARAFARLLVALALLAHARVLAVVAPAVVVAGALAGQVVALAVGVTHTLALAVGAPELSRALGVTARSEVSMATATFSGPDAHLVLLAGEVAFAERRQALVPQRPPAAAAHGPPRGSGCFAYIPAFGIELLAESGANEETSHRSDSEGVLHLHCASILLDASPSLWL